jgi:hypothetical protein
MFGIDREPRLDKSVALKCVNLDCCMYWDTELADELGEGEVWHPEVYSEFQGEPGHGGMVLHYTLDAFDCKECGHEGEEV